MDLSVILPVYNAPDDVAVCLNSLKRRLTGERCELLILNDASDQETTELLRNFVRDFEERPSGVPEEQNDEGKEKSAASQNRPLVRLVEHAENRGYLQTANEGLAAASGEVLVLLNSDTAIPTDFAERVLACFTSDPAIAVASPVASHCGLFSIPMKPGLSGDDVDVMDEPLRSAKAEYPTAIMPDGFCFCVRRSVLEQIGLFDERYDPGYFEETDFGMRALRAGWKTVLIDNLYVYHKAQASFGASRNQALVQRNETLFNELWGVEFTQLRALHPREEHKPRLYARIYSLPERIWRRCARFLAQAIPQAEMRRRIRRKYN